MAKLLILLLGFSVSLSSLADIRILTFDSPPLVNFLRKNSFSGFSVDLMDNLFRRSGIKYSILSKPLKRALFETQRQEGTCTFPVDRNQERESQFKWVGPVAVNRYAFYSHPDQDIPIITLSDAKSYPVAVFAGTGIAEYLLSREFEIYETKSIEQGLHMLRSKRVQLWVADTNSARILARNFLVDNMDPELVFFTTIGFMACNLATPDEEIVKLNAQLKEMYQTGEAQNILRMEQ